MGPGPDGLDNDDYELDHIENVSTREALLEEHRGTEGRYSGGYSGGYSEGGSDGDSDGDSNLNSDRDSDDSDALLNSGIEGTLGDILTHGSGRVSAIANMSNAILGAGIIGLPYAFMQAGFFSGLLLLLAMGVATDWTLRLILYTAKVTGQKSYSGIMDACFGRIGLNLVSLFQFIFAFGGMCAFGIIMGDTIPQVLRLAVPEHLHWLVSRDIIVAVCTLCVSYPLSLQRSMHELSWASSIALVSMVTIIASVIIKTLPPSMGGVEMSYRGDEKERWTFLEATFFNAVGVIAFAFVCHHNSLLIYASLSKPTMDNYAHVTHVSVAFSVVSCTVLSLAGYLTFTNKTMGNLLNNFAPNDILINIARFCFGANMFTTFPLETFVCREVVESYFWPHAPFSMPRHVAITTLLVFVSCLLALVSCSLSSALELVGGFSATSLAYIFPCACFLNLQKEDAFNLRIPRVFAAWACVVFGVFAAVVCTFSALVKMSTASSVC